MTKTPKTKPTQKTTHAASGSLPPATDDQIIRAYNDRIDSYRSLGEEIQFILDDAVQNSLVRVNDVSTRVKSLESTLKKIKDKEYSSIDSVGDLIGGRVVFLFRSDLSILRNSIESNFEVTEFDDKSFADPNSFGYMSLHFQCMLKQHYSGPRCDAIKTLSFEIQLRTICMHAWSAVQHALDYKGEWDVPESLKKDINALSALFYVADTEFASVYAAREATLKRVTGDTRRNQSDSRQVDLDTLRAYAQSRFPERHVPGASTFSELVQQISEAEFQTIGEVDKAVSRAALALKKDEEGRSSIYNAVGAIRISLGIASPKFRQLAYGDSNSFTDEVLTLVKPD